ncbi:MAG TPA: hypothetical protein VLV88_04650 [Terriglobales bacterium]|nr:hypothetical protein [Terriglobales bacterium]
MALLIAFGPEFSEPGEFQLTLVRFGRSVFGLEMNAKRIFEYLRRPGYALRYIGYKAHEFLHRNEPWIAPGAVRFCASKLKSDQIGLEWGSGRSTRWYASRLGKLLSIEFDPNWHRKVSRMITSQVAAECRFIPLDHPLEQPTRRDYDPLPAYVAVVEEFADESLDFVVVDGHYRTACIKQALPKLKEGGLLLVDDTGWLPLGEWGVPSSWPIVHQSANLMKHTTIWQKPTNSARAQ